MVLISDGPINFPGLGLSLEHLSEGFRVFGLHISLSGILVAVAMLIGLFVTEYLVKKTGQDTEQYLDLAIRSVIFGVLGARICYVISHWEYYLYHWAEIFDFGNGGYSFIGALLSGLAATFFFCRKKKISWLQICDTAVPGVLLAQMIGLVGNFIERSALGTYSDGKFAMQVHLIDVEESTMYMTRSAKGVLQGNFLQVHPVALYEILLLFLLFIGIFFLWKQKRIDGLIFGVYLIAYGIIDFCMEFILLDSVKLFRLSLSLEQIAAIGLVIFGVLLMISRIKGHKKQQNSRPKNFYQIKGHNKQRTSRLKNFYQSKKEK